MSVGTRSCDNETMNKVLASLLLAGACASEQAPIMLPMPPMPPRLNCTQFTEPVAVRCELPFGDLKARAAEICGDPATGIWSVRTSSGLLFKVSGHLCWLDPVISVPPEMQHLTVPSEDDI